MAGLIPVGGDGGEGGAPTCFRCGEPAAGPCAMCRLMICAGDDCSVVIEERGLERVVLCADCARRRPILAASAFTAPALLALGAAVLVAVALWGGATTLAGIGYLAGAASMLLSLATAIARWQWRRRLARARGKRPTT